MKTSVKFGFALMALAMMAAPLAAGEKFTVDAGHSAVLFHVKHMGIGISYGRFNEFEGSVDYDKNASAMSFELSVKASSVDTAAERRDKHLRSPDFLNANQFANITFKSTKVERAGDNKLKVTGDFTMLGTTKQVTFDVEETGAGEHPRGGFLRGYHAVGVIKRSEYGMTYGLDNGALADEITLIISLETGHK